MKPIYAATIVLMAFAIGEYVNVKSKARLSAILTTTIVLVAMFWMGMPAEIMTVTGFSVAASTLYGLTMVNMGTMVNIDDMISQWKTLVIGFASVCAICALVVLVGPMFIDRRYAVCGAPVVAGGMPVYLMVKELAEGNGFVEGGIFGLLVLLTQSLVGLPISSMILRKLCKQLLESGELLNGPTEDVVLKKKDHKKWFKPMSQEMCKPVVYLAKGALLTSLATILSELTGGAVHYMIFCLLLGIVACQVGFIEKEFFQKANGFGLMMFMVLAMCFASLPDLTPKLLLSMVIPWIVVFALGILAIFIVTSVLSKILKMPYLMSVVIGLTALYGFPGTFVISNEVSEAVGRTDEERQALLDYLLPKMLVAGFATITISSLLVVGFVLPFF
ncbi:MAG: hypothetical protein Q4F28_06875 [Eubacteriales bacterium]|nr:hypothetical protein [Eubacteriales bacterium]